MPQPFLLMTLLVRDEADILRENIDYHLSQGVDFIIATDNRSVDATPDILREYEQAGVLRYIFEGSDDYSQARWVTRMAQIAHHDYAARWVMHSDADEFWWPDTGTLADTFHRLDNRCNLVVARRTNFVYRDAEADQGNFAEVMIYREKVSLNAAGREILPKVAHLAGDGITVIQGNHNVEGLEPRLVNDDAIEILHFPVRRREQLINKILKGGAAYERNTHLDKGLGRAWRRLYHNYRDNGHLDEYFAEVNFDDQRLTEGLVEGTLVMDTRLRDFLTNIKGVPFPEAERHGDK